MKKPDQIEIKDLDKLDEVDGEDQIAVQRASDGKLYRANKNEVKGDAATVDVHSTETGAAGTDAIVTNEGTTSAAKFKFVIPRGDKGEKGNEGAQVDSVEFSGNDMIFTLDDGSIVTLTNAKLDLKGDTGKTGETGASIISAAFVGNDLVFTKDDSSTVTLANAKIVLKGDTGEVGPAGDEVELRKTETHIEWKLSKETEWNELVALSEITGENGADGQEVSLQKTSTHIQWKLGDGAWQDLIALSELKGEKGEAGDTGITWESTWNAETQYSTRDVVYYDGSSWIATQDNVGKTPSAISDYWDLLALKGTDGEGSGDMIASVYDPAGGEKQVAFSDDGRFTDDRTPLEHGNEKHSTNYLADISGESIGDLSDVTLTAGKTLTITDSTTLSGGTHSGINTGDQVLPTRDSLGLDTDDSPRFAGIELGHASDTTLSRKEAGVLAVEGVAVESTANKRTSFQETPTDTAYVSEKLVKDSLDEKVSIISYTNQLSWGAL